MENDSQNIISGFGYPSEETKAAVDRLWEKIRFLGKNISEIKTKYEDSVEYNKHLEHQISQQNDEIDKFQARTVVIDQLLEQTDSTEEELLESLGALQAKSEQLDKARMDLEFAAKDIAVKNQMIHEKDDEIVKLKDSIALLENDITNAKSSTEELDKLRSEFEDQIEKLNSKISSDEYTIAELRKRRDELDKELIALKDNQEHTTEVNELSSQELESYKTKVEDLESKLQVAKNEVLIKDKTIADSHAAFEDLQKELSSSETTKRELQEKIEMFKQIEASSETMKQKIQNLEEKLQVKNTEYLMKDTKVNELLRANKVQEDKIIELQQTIDNNETQLYQLRKEASEYNKDLMNNDSLMERLRDLSEAKAKIESEKFDLTEQNQELQELLKTRYEQIDILERQINNMLELDKMEIGERKDIAGKIDSLVSHLEQNYNEYISSMNNK